MQEGPVLPTSRLVKRTTRAKSTEKIQTSASSQKDVGIRPKRGDAGDVRPSLSTDDGTQRASTAPVEPQVIFYLWLLRLHRMLIDASSPSCS